MMIKYHGGGEKLLDPRRTFYSLKRNQSNLRKYAMSEVSNVMEYVPVHF